MILIDRNWKSSAITTDSKQNTFIQTFKSIFANLEFNNTKIERSYYVMLRTEKGLQNSGQTDVAVWILSAFISCFAFLFGLPNWDLKILNF